MAVTHGLCLNVFVVVFAEHPSCAKEAKESLQLCDLLSDGLSLDGMFSQTAAGLEKRERWQSWALCHLAIV